jgi:hypothetical protein
MHIAKQALMAWYQYVSSMNTLDKMGYILVLSVLVAVSVTLSARLVKALQPKK